MGGITLRIHRMTAAFGRLQGESLELRDGLNILQAPNETGKSTWCAFLLSILYGINSRERDRAGFIADKNRYAPWSGIPMSGRLDCAAEQGEITLTRSTRRQTSPMGEFRAVYAGTNEPVPGLTGSNCGEELLGVSREVYARSAFIRQNGLAISQDAELERRIAALISSGEEDTSFTEARDALKRQLNRRRHNKTGQLPALEAERSDLERRRAESAELSRQLAQARRDAEVLAAREAALLEELDHCDRWEALRRRSALTAAEAEAAAAEQRAEDLRRQIEADRVPENDAIARLRGAIVNLETTRRAVDRARAERDEAMKALLRAEAAVSESPFAGQSPESARKEVQQTAQSGKIPGGVAVRELAIFFLFLAAGVGAAFVLLSQTLFPPSSPGFCPELYSRLHGSGRCALPALPQARAERRPKHSLTQTLRHTDQKISPGGYLRQGTRPGTLPRPTPMPSPPPRTPYIIPSAPMSRPFCWRSGALPLAPSTSPRRTSCCAPAPSAEGS